MSFFGDNGEDNLRSAKRERTIFSTMAIGHVLAVLIPFALISWGFWEQEKEEELSINIVDEASVGPVVAMETTRLPFDENPTPDVISEPTPEPPTPEPPAPEPPAPEPIPTPPPAPAQPEFVMPKMPTVVEAPPAPKPMNSPRPIPQRIVSQPKFDLPKMPTPKAKPKPRDERVFTPVKDNRMTSTKTGVKSSNNSNDLVPIGNRDAAQRYGKKFSNTPQGGQNKSDQYTARLGGFLKMHWRNYAPSRAELGGVDFEAKIALHIDGSGRLISGTIIKYSGNHIMDAAVRRMLNNLKQYPAPDNRQPVKISSITITLE